VTFVERTRAPTRSRRPDGTRSTVDEWYGGIVCKPTGRSQRSTLEQSSRSSRFLNGPDRASHRALNRGYWAGDRRTEPSPARGAWSSRLLSRYPSERALALSAICRIATGHFGLRSAGISAGNVSENQQADSPTGSKRRIKRRWRSSLLADLAPNSRGYIDDRINASLNPSRWRGLEERVGQSRAEIEIALVDLVGRFGLPVAAFEGATNLVYRMSA
jgi:hypothetical protein